ncbi:beta-N-acetylhexosaminidase [Athalassotoga saccharophila]|uniref:beta-N-acetylhexosaminidase n=1 Tax=Athalassotoga saccharophila TaxID=1441386 RepID=UPI00137A9F71|nr:beta-N-acetylhexosaminidase [Athalassotoga saccharophila]BBJ28797.1 beta-hexosaminidase [Athalassotoga saccharophila]
MSEKVENLLKSMSNEEKIGQIMICGFDGKNPSENIQKLIKNYHLGNVILFKRNIESPDQVKKLTSELQRMSKIPLTIAVDQEGGIVTRLTEPFTVFPGNMATAATNDPHNAYLTGLVMAKEMRAVGINWNLAPVVDVNDLPENPGIGVRSYSDDPRIVARYASEFVRGLHDGHVAACAKHFPGKGHSAKDAHFEMPVVNRELDDLVRIELYPFKELVRDGIDSIMPSHVYYPALCESEIPATLSHAVMTGLLKKEMNFDGVTVTDDLEMGGITTNLEPSEAAWRSLMAGADMIMICHTFEKQIGSIENLIQMVKFGDIPIERLNDAVRRVLNMKENLGLLDGQIVIDSTIGSKENSDIAYGIAKKSVTLVRNMDSLIEKIPNSKIFLIFPKDLALTNVEENAGGMSEIEKLFKEKGKGIESLYVSSKPSESEIEEVTKKISNFNGIVIIGTLNAHLIAEWKKLVNAVMNVRNDNVLILALRNPYDCVMDGVRNSVALYSYSKVSQRAFSEMVLSGERFTGKAPVKL